MCRYHTHKQHSKALFAVFNSFLKIELVNQWTKRARTSHFRTSDVSTAKIMAAKKGCVAAPSRLNNYRFMHRSASKRLDITLST